MGMRGLLVFFSFFFFFTENLIFAKNKTKKDD